MFYYPHYIPHTAVIASRMSYPQVDKLQPQEPRPVKIIEARDGFVTSAEAIYRSRKHVLFTVTLMNGRKGQVVSLKAAPGELLRQPKRLIAVLFDETTGHKEEVEVKAHTPMKVQ